MGERSGMTVMIRTLVLVTGLAFSVPALAGEASVEKVDVRRDGNSWHFSVTVRHADTGWDHYADRWEILAPDGTVLATRVLLHPHVNEQPFTRSLGNVTIPEDVNEVIVRAHDKVHAFGGKTFRLKIRE